MPNRMLRDWTDSLKFEGISSSSEQLFVRLLMKADDYGRFHADARLVSSSCFPLGDRARSEVAECIEELSVRGLVVIYASGGRKFLAVLNWGQRFRGSKPKFPQPDGEDQKWLPTTPTSTSTSSSTTTTTAAICGDLPQDAASCGDLFGSAEGEDEWIEQLCRQFPDRDVRGELKTFKTYCTKKGTAANRRGFVGWIKKATTAIVGRKERYAY